MNIVKRLRIRRRMVQWCNWGIAHEGQIHYAQVRPMPLPPPGSLPLITDCSGMATLFAKWAGAPDPNGNGYNGYGYSGKIADHLQEIPKGVRLHRGDLVVFGNPHTVHVAVVIQRGKDPILMSHGMERGPLRISLSNEMHYHQGEGGYRIYSLLYRPRLANRRK